VLGVQARAANVISEADCNAQKLGATIAPAQIGEPVSGVTLDAPVWTAATDAVPAYCRVTGKLLPVDSAASAYPINFSVVLPAAWSVRAAHFGGGGMNGTVVRGDGLVKEGFAGYGSDSGHTNADPTWGTNEEAIKNFGYMQLKKTHDVAMVLIERAYGAKPRYNYFIGGSQGGREALTAVQRYPADYDGVAASVPVLNFSALALTPTWVQMRQKTQAGMVPAAKVRAIQTAFINQCDKLDGLADGIINNYVDCRARFNTTRQAAKSDPWAAKRCPNDRDPNPADTSASACLTSGQIDTINFVFSTYDFPKALANGNKTHGNWVPTTDAAALLVAMTGGGRGGGGGGRAGGGAPGAPGAAGPGGPPPAAAPGGGGGRAGGGAPAQQARFRGQEGATPDAPIYSSQGSLVLTGFILRDLNANPLEFNAFSDATMQRQLQVSEWVDAYGFDLSKFRARGGKLIVGIGTADTTAAPGTQLDWFQGVINKMGRGTVDGFARFYVLPHTGHGLGGNGFTVDGDGQTIAAATVPSLWNGEAVQERNQRSLTLLRGWVENGVAPDKSQTVRNPDGAGLPLCSYPQYPQYNGTGDTRLASSYACANPKTRT